MLFKLILKKLLAPIARFYLVTNRFSRFEMSMAYLHEDYNCCYIRTLGDAEIHSLFALSIAQKMLSAA